MQLQIGDEIKFMMDFKSTPAGTIGTINDIMIFHIAGDETICLIKFRGIDFSRWIPISCLESNKQISYKKHWEFL